MASKKLLRALGEEIREQRTARGFSQEYLADKAELHRNMVGRLERGETNPSVLVMRSLCCALRMKLSAFFVEVEKRERS